MDAAAGPRWLTYKQAAVRVNRSTRSIRGWHAAGMPMRLVDGEQLVDEDVLLGWFRDRMKASPSHYYRMRAAARAAGLRDPERPASLAPRPREVIDLEPDVDEDADTTVEPFTPSITTAQLLDTLSLRAGADEYAALKSALKHEQTPCADDDRFTADWLGDFPSEVATMAAMCAACPLYALCAAFREAAQPTGGFWAGKAA